MPKFWGGTARKMVGDCLSVAIFISEEGNPWTEKEKEEVWSELEQGLAWLVSQAQEYEITVQFETFCPNWENDIVVGRIPQIEDDATAVHDLANQIAAQLEFENITAFYQDIKGEYNDHNIHFMFLGKVSGRAHMNAIPIADAAQSLEYNMLYHSDEERIDAFAIAHESLHAYSAMDLYDVYGTKQGAYAMKNAEKRAPAEVMLKVSDLNSESSLSEFTAFLVGWHNLPLNRAVNTQTGTN